MELKFRNIATLDHAIQGFNRTFMELKCAIKGVADGIDKKF